MFWESRFFDYQINLGLAGEVGNVELAATDRFHIRERGPDKVFDTCILGGAYRSCCLLDLIGTFFPKIGDEKYAVRPFKCRRKGFGAIQVCLDDFVGEFAMLGRIASQGACFELLVGLQGAYYGASLLPRCAGYRDQLLICAFHLQDASQYLSVPSLLT